MNRAVLLAGVLFACLFAGCWSSNSGSTSLGEPEPRPVSGPGSGMEGAFTPETDAVSTDLPAGVEKQ